MASDSRFSKKSASSGTGLGLRPEQAGRGRPRRWIAVIYALLLALAIPWYWPTGDVRHLFGFPVWGLVVVGVLGITACFTAWVYLTSPDDDGA